MPAMMVNCRCRDCQRALGSTFFPSTVFVFGDFSTTRDEPKFHEVTSDSSNRISRGFCRECGSFAVGRNVGHPDFAFVSGANLDDPTIFKPSLDMFVVSAQLWDHMDPPLPKIPGFPPV